MLDYVILVDAENNDQLSDFRDRLQSHLCACADIDGKNSKHYIGVRDAGALRKDTVIKADIPISYPARLKYLAHRVALAKMFANCNIGPRG